MLAAVAECFVVWLGQFFKLGPFTEEPAPQHIFRSLRACAVAARGRAGGGGGRCSAEKLRHYHSHISRTVPNIHFLTTCSNGTNTADEPHRQYNATKCALKRALQFLRKACDQQYVGEGEYFLCLHYNVVLNNVLL